jgi:hypothetical protein
MPEPPRPTCAAGGIRALLQRQKSYGTVMRTVALFTVAFILALALGVELGMRLGPILTMLRR